MRTLKDSGVEWIGEIPSEWELQRLKAILLERKEKNAPQKTDFILSLGAAYGVVPYNEKEGGGNKAKEDLSAYRLAYPDDIVMNSMNIISGSVGISKYFGCVSPVYYILHPRINGVNQHYYCYMFQTKAFQRSLLGLGNGILMKETENGNFNTVRMRIPMEKLGVQLLPVPSLDEQERIVSFLDCKCAEIDEIIEKTKATIEEYKKLKQSVITEAVTKGIRGDRPMKDSGIEWIGEIPAEWDVVPLQHYVELNKSTLGENTPDDYEFNYVEIGAVTLENGISEYQKYKFVDAPSRARRIVQPNDIIISTVRTYLKAIAIVPEKENVIVSTGFAVLTPKNISVDYLGFALKSEYFVNMVTANSVGISYPAINSSDLIKLKITIPTQKEQEEIADYLDCKCAEFNKLISDKIHLLEELETYKKSLIYEYVTGKRQCESIENIESATVIYPYFPAVLSTDKVRFAQAILMSRILDKCRTKMGRVKAEKMLYTIENSIGFDFDTKYFREAAGPFDDSIYECEGIISRRNKWYILNASRYGVSYMPTRDVDKYKKYYNKYFAEYDTEIERIINIFMNYDADQSEIIATLFAAWNDTIIEKKQASDEEIVDDVLNNWNKSKKRFSKDVWLRALAQMRKDNLIPKGYGKHTVVKS